MSSNLEQLIFIFTLKKNVLLYYIMNVNLISPQENGNSFVVRFKDDIIIPENSKVYLNFASFSRENDVELYEDQTITLSFQNVDVYPAIIPTTPFDNNKLFNSSIFTIPAGTYNYQRLYLLITNGINGLLQDAGNVADLSMYKAIGIDDIDNNDAQLVEGNISFSLGLMKSRPETVPHKPFFIDAQNSKNCDTDGGTVAYRNTATNVVVPSGLRASTTRCAFALAITGTNTLDKTVGTYTNIPLTAFTGIGENATIDFTVVKAGMVLPNPFGTQFSTIGTPDKITNAYANVPLLHNNGDITGITIDFDVNDDGTGVGAIIFSSIVVNAVGAGGTYVVGENLKIGITGTGGVQDDRLEVVNIGGEIQYSSIRLVAKGDLYEENDVLTIPNTGGVGGTADSQLTIQPFIKSPAQASGLQRGYDQPLFDNYALSEKTYWHIGYNDETPLENCNIIKFSTIQTLAEMDTALQCCVLGLYSKEVADGIAGVNGTYPLDSSIRTRGVADKNNGKINPRNLPDEDNIGAKQLGCFVSVSIDCRSTTNYLKVFVGAKGNGSFPNTDGLHNWTSSQHQIFAMKNCSVAGRGSGIPINTISNISTTEPLTFGLQTYYDVDELKSTAEGAGKLYFRVLNLNGNVDGKKSVADNSIVLYDSKHMGDVGKESHFPPAFFKASNANVRLDTNAGKISTNMGHNTLTIGTGNRTLGSYTVNLTGGSGYGASLSLDVVPRGSENKIAIAPISTDFTDLTVVIGTGARTNGTYANVNLTGGTGNGAQATFVITTGAIDPTAITITNAGTGYNEDDILNIDVALMGGNADATIQMDAVPVAPSVFNAGDGYKIGDVLILDNTAMGGNANATFTINSNLDFSGLVNRINSQMPLCMITSALKLDGGFSTITAPSYTKNNAKPLSLLVKYDIEATEELARYLSFNTATDKTEGYSDDLFPNTGDAMNRNLIHLEGMTLDWRNESYSVSIKELPIKNYKNNEKLRNGGFSKPILANCPVPFSDAQSYQTKSKQMITAVYKPNYQVISNLYNQQMTTNTFSVDINKLQSEKPANEIKKSIINFTILPPDNYTGNINSISGLN